MHRRKIQLIAGTTYSISLPKEWVKKNNLREKKEVILSERNDMTLVVSPAALKDNKIEEVTLNLDEYTKNIDQVLFAVYYLGVENIHLHSKNDLTKDMRAAIRKTLTHMSGTEISYEDNKKITLRVLLDKSKVDVKQILYRICLLIGLSITSLLEDFNINEIRMNENEIDRLYHLMAKIISLSLIDSNILGSSNIQNISHIPSYFLMSKKLENLGDNIKHMSEILSKNNGSFEHKKEILIFIKTELNRSMKHIMQPDKRMFEQANDADKIRGYVAKIKDKTISEYLRDAVRYLMDIEGEIVQITFYERFLDNKTA